MADDENRKQPGEFATQYERVSPDNALANAEVKQREYPDQSGSFGKEASHHSSDEEHSPSDLTMGASRSQENNDLVRVPMDAAGMEPVHLEFVDEATTAQPKSGRSFRPLRKKNKEHKTGIDFVNRDPENLQEIIKVNFADIIAEPSGAHSFNTIWGSSYKVYSVTKFWLYKILTLICGVPCALFWGIYFACLAFFGIWLIMPCIKAIKIKMNFLSQLWSLCIRTLLDPIFASIGLILSRIRIMLTLHRDQNKPGQQLYTATKWS